MAAATLSVLLGLIGLLVGLPVVLLLAPGCLAVGGLGLLAGWTWVADRTVSGIQWALDPRRRRLAPLPTYTVVRQLAQSVGQPTWQLTFRGGDHLPLDRGDLVQVVTVGGRRQRHVLWARQVTTGRRWVCSTVTWGIVWGAIAVSAGLVWSAM